MSVLTNNRITSDYERNEVLIERFGPAMDRFAKRYQITMREKELLLLIAVYGLSNREIAERCEISEKTVKNHIANIMNKLGIQSMRKLLSVLLCNVLHAAK